MGINDYLNSKAHAHLHEQEDHGHLAKESHGHGHGHSHGHSHGHGHGHGHGHDHDNPEDQIKVLKFKLRESEKFIAHMRTNFNKEIVNMQSQMGVTNHIKMHGFQHMEVKYFDATELINDDIRNLLNAKLIEMRSKYEMAIVNKTKEYKSVQQKVELFKKLQTDGFIQFDQMTAHDVIRKLKIICDDPEEIWDSFMH